MFLKSLTITKGAEVIRDIQFGPGINLIVDNTEADDETSTGNNVGKTTVLKLIDMCLGGKKQKVWSDTEDKKAVSTVVKDYLIKNRILITLVLSNDLEEPTIVIKRNFIERGKAIIREINGVHYTLDRFKNKLSELLFPDKPEKPTMRQLISHNIRYKDLSINNTLKTLDANTKEVEYETLYLYMMGCSIDHASQKEKLFDEKRIETRFKKKLEKEQSKSSYVIAIKSFESQIAKLDQQRKAFDTNPNFEKDLEKLNQIKYQISRKGTLLSQLKLKKDLIERAQESLSKEKSDIDTKQLAHIYQQAKQTMGTLQKTFDQMLTFHNKMVEEKKNFIGKNLPILKKEIAQHEQALQSLLEEQNAIASTMQKSETLASLEKIIKESQNLHEKKGNYKARVDQIEATEEKLKIINADIKKFETDMFSEDRANAIKSQVFKFNEHFSKISNALYGENYALTVDTITKNNDKVYEFSTFNINNMSSGKKQGEISCFDIAYTIFADQEGIPCLHFLLNDKKELMHDNQLDKIAKLVQKENIQFVASILKDKLPESLNDEKYFIIELSQQDKLFRIENQ